MTNSAVLWPAMLGVLFLAAGMITYWPDTGAPNLRGIRRLLALGPVFVAAGLAAFAGEHFTAAESLAKIVPAFLPGRLFLAYFVGVAHLAAALSFVARRYVRLSAISLAAMFALFVVLMDLPAAVSRPEVRIFWVLAVREATFAIGALTLFAIVTRAHRPNASARIATFARLWTACVLVFYGIVNVVYPQFAPGVPSMSITATWIPAPHVITILSGAAMVAGGIAMFAQRTTPSAAAWIGLLMTVLVAMLFVPQFFVEHSAARQVIAINFVFDTLLFGGMVLVVGWGTASSFASAVRPPTD